MKENYNSLQKESFETKLTKLEKIAKNLSENNSSLEQSLVEFERGILLSKECHQILQKTEQKVKVLLQNEDKTWQENNYK